jgi:nitroimidazol reductase NimA-like FMN-containing flavoprotein (pyridoxamine 5'-phosphate oxidase superfamily)
MEKPELLAYLRKHRLGVLGTVSPAGQTQGALVGYAVSNDLEILFDTVRTSRKYQNIAAHPEVSFTIGNTAPPQPDERTAQYEGIAEELTGTELDRLRPIYYSVWTDGPQREHWPGICWFVIRPRWIRYTDYDIPLTQEWTF